MKSNIIPKVDLSQYLDPHTLICNARDSYLTVNACNSNYLLLNLVIWAHGSTVPNHDKNIHSQFFSYHAYTQHRHTISIETLEVYLSYLQITTLS